MPQWSSENTLTTTNLQSLASSATAGWGSAAIDNTGTKYDDAAVQVCLDPANTSPANSKGFFVFVWGASNSSDYPTTGASSGGGTGTEGALTFPDITTTPNNLCRAQFFAYAVADVAQKAPTFSVRKALGLAKLPPYWGVAILNHSGAALASSANAVKWRGLV